MRFPRTTRPLAVALAAAAACLMVGNAAAQPSGTARSAAAAVPVRGFVDAHTHAEGHENLGGRIICGKPFDPDGIEQALRDCDDHQPNGEGALLENFMKNGSPFGTHATQGYPTFKDWPAYNSLTHQQVYYEWLERSWRGGQRILVDQLVANRVLCDVYPLKKNPCDEQQTIRIEAKHARDMQAFIDAKHGGPGKGWFRIVSTPAEARQVIGQGKLAVVPGIEQSEPFGCRQTLGIPHCTRAQIDKGLDEMKALGVRSMFVCHKFDNALCGVRFDSGTAGVIVNLGNFLSTKSLWQARTCTGAAHDNPIEPSLTLPEALRERLSLPKGLSIGYPPAPHCNVKGLTDLGAHMVRGMMKRGMIVELDHMSVKAADETLKILEEARYPGVISSHGWSDPTFLPRIYRLGGMVTGYGHKADQFAEGWRQAKKAHGGQGPFGYGYGLDANGFGHLPSPRDGSQVKYPFASFDGSVTLDRLRTGQRTWDLNVDGVANYGLVPDWIEDMRLSVGDELVQDMANGAETYLRMWEGATNHPATG
ncbi:Coagulation factor 5/8 type domain-containing protein [Spirillospora sp. CA-294931]|uniref:Coagulation factor 5/8 type domain-containing protein n=1 Tax=Spirillospora sp. CA-294931 TaxID=3240042 RepID=UPI003D8C50AB